MIAGNVSGFEICGNCSKRSFDFVGSVSNKEFLGFVGFFNGFNGFFGEIGGNNEDN